jgi:chloramphenicol O-acetyltransferase type A
MGHYVDLERWNRREHHALYRQMAQPFGGVCVEVDATALWLHCRAPGGPRFSIAALFVALRAAQATEAFRLRLRGEGVWMHDRIGASTTVLRDDETFAFARVQPCDDFETFHATAAAALDRARGGTEPVCDPPDDALIYHSVLPWLRFTAVTNPVAHGDDSVPRVVMGRCTRVGRRWRLPVAVSAHHALVDGLDLARFVARVERGLAEPPR